MTRDTVITLRKTRRLLHDSDKWNKFHSSIGIAKSPCHYGSVDACSWCLSGAIQRVCLDNGYGLTRRENATQALLENIPLHLNKKIRLGIERVSVTRVNDLPTTKYKDIIGWIDHAIKEIQIEIGSKSN